MGMAHHGSGSLGHDFTIAGIRACELSARGLWLDNPAQQFLDLVENWSQKPGINADRVLADASGGAGPNAAAFAAFAASNPNFELLGTNKTSALCTFCRGTGLLSTPGITLNTAGADADQMILVPNLITNETAWGSFLSQQQMRFEPKIRTGGKVAAISNAARSTTTASITTSTNHNLSIGQSVTIALLTGPTGYAALNGTYLVTGLTSATVFTYTTTTSGTVTSGAGTGSVTTNTLLLQTIWTGLKKTNTDVIATDDDQFYARYLAGENGGNWQIVTSRAGVDSVTVLPVPVLPNTVYRFRFNISDTLVPSVRLNGVRYNLTPGQKGSEETGDTGNAPLTSGVALIPYTGTSANGTTPGRKAIDVLPDYRLQVAA